MPPMVEACRDDCTALEIIVDMANWGNAFPLLLLDKHNNKGRSSLTITLSFPLCRQSLMLCPLHGQFLLSTPAMATRVEATTEAAVMLVSNAVATVMAAGSVADGGPDDVKDFMAITMT